jgi:hypothetical protein
MFYVIDGGMRLLKMTSAGTDEERAANAKLLVELSRDPIYRAPWRTDEEAAAFRAEVADIEPGTLPLACGFSAADYLAGNPDVAKAGHEPLRHYLEFGAHEGRLIMPDATARSA